MIFKVGDLVRLKVRTLHAGQELEAGTSGVIDGQSEFLGRPCFEITLAGYGNVKCNLDKVAFFFEHDFSKGYTSEANAVDSACNHAGQRATYIGLTGLNSFDYCKRCDAKLSAGN